jgi:hypothetical protein
MEKRFSRRTKIILGKVSERGVHVINDSATWIEEAFVSGDVTSRPNLVAISEVMKL